ncbi:MAG: hypothetical protein LBS98_00700 [Coriobacteriales bacterium]|jgi:hypothetical protein|nr:hypothetical protein [Coriobacteriales bacterium]
MLKGCLGAAGIKGTPTWDEKICPVCGAEIELFSVDMSRKCSCGFIAYNDRQTCVEWCGYARECVGDEMYEHMQKLFKERERRSNNP